MSRSRHSSISRRRTPATAVIVALAVMATSAGCAQEETGPGAAATQQADPAAEQALEQTALEVGEAFANRDRGRVERTEAWLPELRGDYEAARGVRVTRGTSADDGLVLLTHAATDTYKCIAVTGAADVAGEPVQIARISIGEPRC